MAEVLQWRQELSDKDKWISFLREFGIGFSDEGHCIQLEQGHAKVDGYPGFFASINFLQDGSFDSIGVWE